MSADPEGWRALGVDLTGIGGPFAEDPDQISLFDISHEQPPARFSAPTHSPSGKATPR
ncbi:hypothetical protein AB0C34_17270 [Nocardia sp. NPDC049220]|uniref:hypothetical protein n=1 Tax=Nocardia sp. NPDC049220 TaxID=3155273 RepID=UPI0033D95980